MPYRWMNIDLVALGFALLEKDHESLESWRDSRGCSAMTRARDKVKQ